MAKVYLFNPENDVALGYWKQSFTLSPLVKALHLDGASLPMWYASDDDYVFDPRAEASVEWRREMSDKFGLEANVSSIVPEGLEGMPWGWSYDACRQLLSIGAEVPDMERVEKLRVLSHRRLTVEVMCRLREMLPFAIPDLPSEAKSLADVKREFEERGRDIFIKAPWSSSGRGVVRANRWTDGLEARVGNIIRRQGSVMCETAVDKRHDFAMEFRSEGGRVEWLAYSLFFNEHDTSYGGNILAPDSELESMLVDDGADSSQLEMVRRALERIFTELIAPYYEGYFGVDMMVASDGMIVPCVEVNLRMTMGVVAALWRNRYLSPGSRASYSVGMCVDGESRPLVVADGRLVSGSVLLTAPDERARFAFKVDASEL